MVEEILTAIEERWGKAVCREKERDESPPRRITICLERDLHGSYRRSEDSSSGKKIRARQTVDEENEQPQAKRSRAGKVPRPKTKMVDVGATHAKFEARIQMVPDEEWEVFNDAYITDYGLDATDSTANPPTSHAFLLARLAARRGYHCRGFISSNQSKDVSFRVFPMETFGPKKLVTGVLSNPPNGLHWPEESIHQTRCQ